MEKPFWKSKKFAYTLGTFLAALIVWLLPQVIDMTPEQLEMLNTILPGVFVTGVMLLLGHTATDIVFTWKGGVQSKEFKDAVIDVVVEVMEDLGSNSTLK